MSVEVRVPQMGESIVDATIATWLKHEGEQVQKGDVLAELETDKVNVEVSAEESGVLQQILKKEGDVVGVGDVIGIIGEAAAQQPTPAQPATSQQAPSQPAEQQPAATQAPTQSAEQQPAATTAASDGQRTASPLARRIAAEHNIDLSQIPGSSPHGRVTRGCPSLHGTVLETCACTACRYRLCSSACRFSRTTNACSSPSAGSFDSPSWT